MFLLVKHRVITQVITQGSTVLIEQQQTRNTDHSTTHLVI